MSETLPVAAAVAAAGEFFQKVFLMNSFIKLLFKYIYIKYIYINLIIAKQVSLNTCH